ncbi:MAG: multiheme c-type cytochrome [candidate division WOR-3 bacterium]
MKKLLILVIGITFCMAQEKKEEKKFEYVGSEKCKVCHKGEKKGSQWEIWEKSNHSKAFETLASEKSKEIAKKMEIEDPQKSEKCLSCHNGKDNENGIGCEDCHGPGSEYKAMSVMKKIYSGEAKPEDYGLIRPTEKNCIECHNENSPTYKEFKFEEFYEKIKHPVPKEK